MMPHEPCAKDLVLLTYAVAASVEEGNLDELACLLKRREELVHQLGATLDDDLRSQVAHAERRVRSVIAAQKAQIASQIHTMFYEQRSRNAYRQSDAA